MDFDVSLGLHYVDDRANTAGRPAKEHLYTVGRTYAGKVADHNMPTTSDAYQTAAANAARDSDGYLMHKDVTQDQTPTVDYASFVGGSKWDVAASVAVSSDLSKVYVGGSTMSPDFPIAAMKGEGKSNLGYMSGVATRFTSISSDTQVRPPSFPLSLSIPPSLCFCCVKSLRFIVK